MEHHHHHHDISGKGLGWSVALNALITIAQFVGGMVSGSLALLGDALHNFSDVMSLVIAYYAHRLSHRPHTPHQTFGFKRAQIVSALFNASILIAVSIYLIVESIDHLRAPQNVASEWVILLAALGIAINGLSAWMLHRDAHRSLNIRSAYWHLVGDLMTSIAVLCGGVVMAVGGWYWIDPLLSILISLYLIRISYGIVSQAARMLMQFAPEHITVEMIAAETAGVEGIEGIHHIHLWQLDDESVFLEARLNFYEDIPISIAQASADELSKRLLKLGITHTPFQPGIGQNGRDQVAQRCGLIPE